MYVCRNVRNGFSAAVRRLARLYGTVPYRKRRSYGNVTAPHLGGYGGLFEPCSHQIPYEYSVHCG